MTARWVDLATAAEMLGVSTYDVLRDDRIEWRWKNRLHPVLNFKQWTRMCDAAAVEELKRLRERQNATTRR